MAGEILVPNQAEPINVKDGEIVPIYRGNGTKHLIIGILNGLKYVQNVPESVDPSRTVNYLFSEVKIFHDAVQQTVLEGNFIVRAVSEY